MKRELALVILDELTLRGYSPSLTVFNGESEETSGQRRRLIHRPIYSVRVNGLVEPSVIDENDMRQFVELAAQHNVDVAVDPNHGRVHFTERS